ncbi:MAG TPA: Ppx/GppA phosphatase family protein [Candidatus Limnocylindrales bacterium]
MAAIVPRWEWRMFGDPPAVTAAVLETLPITAVQESDETYYLSRVPDADTVKLRASLMDVKVLREVDAEGLERWEPVFKVAFPLSAEDVARVGRSLRISTTAQAGPSADLAVFDAVVSAAGIRAVAVHKVRRRFELEGCTGEWTEVTADGLETQTIAVESPDAAAVVRARNRLRLDGFVNTDYPSGLAALLDGIPERYAVIDAGTNSIKFHVAEREPDGAWRAVVDRAEITRLGEGLEATGRIGAEPLERVVTAIAGMADEARAHRVRAIVAVGTAGLRIASNAAEVLTTIRDRTGVAIEVISGEDESRLAYQAAARWGDLGEGPVVVFDTGGGSTQFTFGHGTQVDERFSVDLGAVRITERFGLAHAVGPDVIDAARAAIASDLARIAGREAPEALVGMGGAVTNIAAVMHGLAAYDPDVIQGSIVDRAELDRQIERYRSLDADGRRSIVGLQPKRAEVILAGACIVRTVLDLLGQDRLTVSDRGLRHGVLVERFAH